MTFILEHAMANSHTGTKYLYESSSCYAQLLAVRRETNKSLRMLLILFQILMDVIRLPVHCSLAPRNDFSVHGRNLRRSQRSVLQATEGRDRVKHLDKAAAWPAVSAGAEGSLRCLPQSL